MQLQLQLKNINTLFSYDLKLKNGFLINYVTKLVNKYPFRLKIVNKGTVENMS